MNRESGQEDNSLPDIEKAGYWESWAMLINGNLINMAQIILSGKPYKGPDRGLFLPPKEFRRRYIEENPTKK